jgi:segregation and condensation protein A
LEKCLRDGKNGDIIQKIYAILRGTDMGEPQYRLEGIVRTRTEAMDDFEGPLDVIFLLLSKNKIEIQDVSITAILEQYLAYLDEMKRLDMEIASEFITMASHLMLIKTKMLLSAAEAAEAQSELDLLRQSLIDRQRKEALEQIRMAITVLEPRNDIGRCVFVKEPEPLRRDATYRYKHQPEDLLRALADIAERGQRRLPPPRSPLPRRARQRKPPPRKQRRRKPQRRLLRKRRQDSESKSHRRRSGRQ